jgi:hypothetical protein
VIYNTEQKNSTCPFLTRMWVKASKGLTSPPTEMDCDQTVMGLPPVTSAVFRKAKSFSQNVGVLEEYLASPTPSRIKLAWYLCMLYMNYKNNNSTLLHITQKEMQKKVKAEREFNYIR